jgi:hypothetical protein
VIILSGETCYPSDLAESGMVADRAHLIDTTKVRCAETRKWAEGLYAQFGDSHGLWWTSRRTILGNETMAPAGLRKMPAHRYDHRKNGVAFGINRTKMLHEERVFASFTGVPATNQGRLRNDGNRRSHEPSSWAECRNKNGPVLSRGAFC